MNVTGPVHGAMSGATVAGAPAHAAEAAAPAINGLEPLPATAHGLEAALVQTGVNASSLMRDPAPAGDASPPAPDAHGSEPALPQSQLAQATLVSLTVDPETWWLLQRDGVPRRHADSDEELETGRPDWRESVSRAVRSALDADQPPAAVRAIDEEWRRGRRVVLACPRGRDAGGPAWAYVTGEPRSSSGGARLPARLRWFDVPGAAAWRHARLEGSYHPLCGRYLDVAPAAAGMRSPCMIQFGPTLSLWRSDVCVRIDAVGSFWDALGLQWSVIVAVSTLPLEAPSSAQRLERAP